LILVQRLPWGTISANLAVDPERRGEAVCAT